MLPWSSTTLALPARRCRPSTFCVTSRNSGTRCLDRRERAVAGVGLRAARRSSRRNAYQSQTSFGLRANASGVASSQRIELRPQARSARRETSARRIRRRCRRRSARRRARCARRSRATRSAGSGTVRRRRSRRDGRTRQACGPRDADGDRTRSGRRATLEFGLSSPRQAAYAHVRQHVRHALLRHVVRRIARSGDRLRRRRLPAGTGARARPTSSASSTAAGPARRGTSRSGASPTPSRSSPACSRAAPPARRSRS